MTFQNNMVTISKNETPIAFAIPHGINLYRVIIQSVSRTEANVAIESDILTWHERLGYSNIKVLRELDKKGFININRFPKNDEFFCEACQFGKQNQRPFHSTQSRETKPGELIHSDVGGPMQSESIGGSRFYVIFKDDASGYTHIFP